MAIKKTMHAAIDYAYILHLQAYVNLKIKKKHLKCPWKGVTCTTCFVYDLLHLLVYYMWLYFKYTTVYYTLPF